MPSLDGGAILVESLHKAGVKHIFSVSAGSMGSVYRSCAAQGIRVIHTRHEGPAAFMADGWARVTGQPGVCLVTHGVGLTNASTGVATAWMDQSPMIALALSAARGRVDKGNLQDIDQLGVMRPITKWAQRVPEAKRLPEYLAMAARHALAGPPGPVMLELPIDILDEQVDESAVAHFPWPIRYTPAADQRSIARAAELIAQAERPIIIAGSGVRWAEAGEELEALAETAQVPTFTRRMAWTQMRQDHPLHFGAAWFSQNGVLGYAAARSDLVVVVGARLFYDLEHGQAPLLNAEAKIVQIDIDPTNIGHNRPVEVGIQADAGVTLAQLTEALRSESVGEERAAWIDDLKARRAEADADLEKHFRDEESPIHPLRLWAEVARVLPADTLLVAGQGEVDFWAERVLPVRRRGNFVRGGRSGCLGAEIPFGIAAKLARPNEPVVVTTGDGGFGFSGMELDTAARCNVPIVVVIGNDAAWACIKNQVVSSHGKEADVFLDLLPQPYHLVAEALGGYGEHVADPAQIGPAMLRALESGKPSVIDVSVRTFPSPLTRWLSQGQRHPLPLVGVPPEQG